ncbi:hypothetical protein P7C70_g4491, partial [Phenoliferia sp. Uapishka_3]
MVGFWVAGWSLMTSHILYIKSRTDRRGSNFPFYMSATFANSLGIMVPFLQVVSVVPLAMVASNYYEKGMGRYQTLDNLLHDEQNAYNGTFDASFVTAHIEYAVVYYVNYQKWFAYSFYLLLGWGLAGEIFLIGVGGTHSWALAKAVQSMKSRRAPGMITIQKTYKSLVWMCLAFIGSTTVLNANYLFVGHYGKKVNTKPLQAQIATLLAPYIVSAICLPLSFLLLHRAFLTGKISTAGSGNLVASERSRKSSGMFGKAALFGSRKPENSTWKQGWTTTVDGFETLAMKTVAGVEAEAGGEKRDSQGDQRDKIAVDVVTVHFTEGGAVLPTLTKEDAYGV